MKISISKLSSLNAVIVSIFFTIVILYFVVFSSFRQFDKKTQIIRENYIQSQKELIKHEVERVVKRLNQEQKACIDKAKIAIRDRVVSASYLVSSFIKQYPDKSLAISKISSILQYFHWNDNTGYYFLYNKQGIVLFHGCRKEFEGKNIDIQLEGFPDVQKALLLSKSHDEIFVNYKWFKGCNDIEITYEKLTFIKNIPGTDLYIAAGIYLDEIEKELKQTMLEMIEQERFGYNQYGYFWIHTTENRVIMHPINKELVGKVNTTDADGRHVLNKMTEIAQKNGFGFYSYKWMTPFSKIPEEKTSFFMEFSQWGWIIGSGFYYRDLSEHIQKEEMLLKQFIYDNVIKLIIITISIFFITLFISFFINRHITRIETERDKNINMLNQYKDVLDKSSIVTRTDSNGYITYANESFFKVSGFTHDEAVGNKHNIIRHPDTPKSEFTRLWQMITSGNVYYGVIKNRKKDKTSYYNRTTIMPLMDEKGIIQEYISSSQDITELIENRERLTQLFETDKLTGLGNRIKLLQELEKSSGFQSLCIVNIDRFSSINDYFGIDAGDKILKTVGDTLYTCLAPKGYFLYRLYSDRFAVLKQNEVCGPMEQDIKEALNEINQKDISAKDSRVNLNFSCGYACMENNAIAYADIALKHGKKFNIEFTTYNPLNEEMNGHNSEYIKILSILKDALDEDRIIPYFQPIYDLEKEKTTKFECLMRLIDNEGNIISPAIFMNISKQTRMYPLLTGKMIEKSIKAFKGNDFTFSINLSVEDIFNPETMEFLYYYADKNGVIDRMIIEIVETEEMSDIEAVLKIFRKFREKGTKIAVDDFGSGYSNFDYLLELKADFIKIDGVIIKKLNEMDERAVEIVKSVVAVAKTSKLETIAEFISSKKLSDQVKALGVKYAQGYYYGKPQKNLPNIIV